MELGHFEMPVSDMDRAFAFYADTLGLPIIGRFGDAAAWFFLGGVHGCTLRLTLRPDAPFGQGPVLGVSGGADIASARSRLEAAGVRFLGETIVLGPVAEARFADSEGNVLALTGPGPMQAFRAQAALPLAEVRELLTASEAAAMATIEGLDNEAALRAPKPGEWPVADVLGHIAAAIDWIADISAALATGAQPEREGSVERDYSLPSLAAAESAVRDAYARVYDALAGLPSTPNTTATVRHGVFGALNALEWMTFGAWHTGLHVSQSQATRAAVAGERATP